MASLVEWLLQGRPDVVPAPRKKRSGQQGRGYIVNGMAVHLLGADLPLRCVRCRGLSSLACDFPLEDGGTCSAPLCPDCAKQVRPDLHLCPLHLRVVLNRRGSLL